MKGVFLNGYIEEEIYVVQPPGFVDFKHPNHVFKLKKKKLYRLKQTPRSWYERLNNFLIGQSFIRSRVDKPFIKRSNELFFVQIYVDDIVLGTTNESLCKEFSNSIQKELDFEKLEIIYHF